ncbi:MAG: hypothetical protein ABJA49_11540 [Betaproteobacteria bacterium]
MGIVVCIFMLLGLLVLWPWPSVPLKGLHSRPAWIASIATGVLLAGAWNALWHGLRHLDAFWGLAALASGTLMVAAAALVLRRWRRAGAGIDAVLVTHRNGPARLLFAGLLACFVLYAVTLVRLNLGYSIIGQ